MKENVCGIMASKNGSSNAAQGLLCHRSDLYEELKRLATGEGEGPPTIPRLGTTVVASDPEQGTVTLKGGEIIETDCILGADGIHVCTTLFSFLFETTN
jgi:salicylate hydroxylase